MVLLQRAKYGASWTMPNGQKITIERCGEQFTFRLTGPDDELGCQEFVSVATLERELNIKVEREGL